MTPASGSRRQSFVALALALGTGFAAGAGWYSGILETNGQAQIEPPPPPRIDLLAAERSTIEVFERTSKSVVYITSLAWRRDFFRMNLLEIPQGSGSGFVWDDQGHIVTNFHVIQRAQRAEVTLADHTTWEARLIGAEPDKDLAVLQIEAPLESLRPLEVGSSTDLLVGQTVYAIGNPFGLDQSLSTGVISALGREIESVSRVPIRDVIQTDAAINPGNSGGPLLDSSGRLIGVNTAIYSPSGAYAGVGFAIPTDTVRLVVEDLIEYGVYRRPSLGVDLVNDAWVRRAELRGALVLEVEPGSGADKAGLRPTRRDRRGRIVLGDLIVAIGEEPIESSHDLVLALEAYDIGDEVAITIVRQRRQVELWVELDGSQP